MLIQEYLGAKVNILSDTCNILCVFLHFRPLYYYKSMTLTAHADTWLTAA